MDAAEGLGRAGLAAVATAPIERDELRAWLRLLTSPGLGRDGARQLLAAFGSPQAVFQAELAAHAVVVPPALARAIADPPPGLDALLERTVAWLAAGTPEAPHFLLTLADTDYPAALLHTADPPLLLYAVGQRGLLATPMVAVVGSRQPTPQGIEAATLLAGGLAAAGWTVVSGLALGIDGAAHSAALDAGGPSIAVVGTGIDRVYPARHRALAHRLASQGLLLSEFALGSPPLGGHFPMRNRIIAGLSRGTLVVEAALRSGSLTTARLAAECGREVMAVPGSIQSPQSSGCHWLIKQGATLVEAVDDVLAALDPGPGAARPRMAELRTPDAGEDEAAEPTDHPTDPVLEALGHGPVSLDALLARTGLSVVALGAALLALELDGRVARLPGQLFQRVGQG